MSDESLETIYRRVALALNYAQMVETNLVTVLAVCQKAVDNLDPVEYFQLSELWSKKTMGQLVAQVRPLLGSLPNLQDRLDQAREKRNYIVHRYFQENAERLMLESHHEALLDELSEIVGHLKATTEELQGILQRVLLASGMTQDEYHRALVTIQAGLLAGLRDTREH